MTNGRVMAAAALAAVLAACSPPAQQASAPQSAEQAQASVAAVNAAMETGQWRTTITVTEANIPGVPANIASQMMGQPITVEECRTTADAQEMAQDWAQDEPGCATGTFRFNGNQFEGEQTCTSDGATTTVRYTGTLTPTRMEGVSEVNAQTPAGAMTQRATIVSERIGPCAG